LPDGAIRLAVALNGGEDDDMLAKLHSLDVAFILLQSHRDLSSLHARRRVFEFLKKENLSMPVIHHYVAETSDTNELALQLGTNIGAHLTDGNGDGVLVEQSNNHNDFSVDLLRKTSFSLLQGSRMRNTKTEFVSCPSCGRTLFDLQETTANIQSATGHLPGVTVAVMGCIVNGPGEMADADFGYVGTLPGKVDLYYGKEVVKKSIPNEQAVEALVELIKEYGMWKDKEEAEEDVKELVVA
jgi:(E)-4-hydroxy-3-methylbut-2-enyl-diphosphate synthase